MYCHTPETDGQVNEELNVDVKKNIGITNDNAVTPKGQEHVKVI